jgi:hypothetical protein
VEKTADSMASAISIFVGVLLRTGPAASHGTIICITIEGMQDVITTISMTVTQSVVLRINGNNSFDYLLFGAKAKFLQAKSISVF